MTTTTFSHHSKKYFCPAIQIAIIDDIEDVFISLYGWSLPIYRASFRLILAICRRGFYVLSGRRLSGQAAAVSDLSDAAHFWALSKITCEPAGAHGLLAAAARDADRCRRSFQ